MCSIPQRHFSHSEVFGGTYLRGSIPLRSTAVRLAAKGMIAFRSAHEGMPTSIPVSSRGVMWVLGRRT
jgi:hypothetical protein